MIFAALVLERDPMRWQDLPAYLISWIQNAGGFAALGLLVWLVVRWVRPAVPSAQAPISPFQRILFVLCLLGALVSYLALLGLKVPEMLASMAPAGGEKTPNPEGFMP